MVRGGERDRGWVARRCTPGNAALDDPLRADK